MRNRSTMKARFVAFLIGATVAACLPAVCHSQTLGETAAATGIASDLNKRGATSGVDALKRAKNALAPALAPPGVSGNMGPNGTGSPKQTPGGAPIGGTAPAPAPTPWIWRLKGSVWGDSGRVAVFEAPDGTMRYVRSGQQLDAHTRVVSVGERAVVVLLEKKRLTVSAW